MIQFFSKKIRNKKGFTLIELIVVIAILGILAAIAVPRFSGFTNRGKVAADEQYVAIVANSIVTLMAAGEITAGGTYTINPSNGKVTKADPQAGFLQTELEKLIPAKKLQSTTVGNLVIDADGSYTLPTITP